MARYYVGNGIAAGKWWNRTQNWSASSGGAGSAGVPTSIDDVFFDANSGDCDLNLILAECNDFVTTGYLGTIDINGNTLNVVTDFALTGGTLINSGTVKWGDDFQVSSTWTDVGGALTWLGNAAACTWSASITTTFLRFEVPNTVIIIQVGDVITVLKEFYLNGDQTNAQAIQSSNTGVGQYTIDFDAGIVVKSSSNADIADMLLGAGDALSTLLDATGVDSGNNDVDITFIANPDSQTAGNSGLWSAGGTWGLGSVPGTGDVVIIDLGDTVTLEGEGACSHIYIFGTLTHDGQTDGTPTVARLTVDDGDSVIVAGTLDSANANDTGYPELKGDTGATCEVNITSAGTWTVGPYWRANNVCFCSPSTVPIGEKMTQTGNCDHDSGCIVEGEWDAGAFQLEVDTGELTISGTFTGGSGNIVFEGITTVGGGGTITFGDVELGSPATVFIRSDTTITGDTTIGAGDILDIDGTDNTVTVTWSKTGSQPQITGAGTLRFSANTTNFTEIEGNATFNVDVNVTTVDYDFGGSGALVYIDRIEDTVSRTTGGDGVTVTMVDDCLLYKMIVSSGDTLRLDTGIKANAITLQWTDTDVAGFGTSGQSMGTLELIGDVTNGITMESQGGTSPTYHWRFNTGMDVEIAYATITAFVVISCEGDLNVINTTFAYNKSTSPYGIRLRPTANMIAFTDTIIDNCYGSSLLIQLTIVGLDNVVITNVLGGGIDVEVDDVRAEFESSNFDIENCDCNSIGWLTSKDHNDQAGEFYIVMAHADSQDFSDITTEPDSGDNITFYPEVGGSTLTFYFDEADKTFGDIEIEDGVANRLNFTATGITVNGSVTNIYQLYVGSGATPGEVEFSAVGAGEEIILSFRQGPGTEIVITSTSTITLTGSEDYQAIIREAGTAYTTAPTQGITISGGTLTGVWAEIYHMNNLLKSSTLNLTDSQYWFVGSGEQTVAATWNLTRSFIRNYSGADWWVKATGTINMTGSFLYFCLPTWYSTNFYIIWHNNVRSIDFSEPGKIIASVAVLGGRGQYKETTGYKSSKAVVKGLWYYEDPSPWAPHPLEHRYPHSQLESLKDDEDELGAFTCFKGSIPQGVIKDYKHNDMVGTYDKMPIAYTATFEGAPVN